MSKLKQIGIVSAVTLLTVGTVSTGGLIFADKTPPMNHLQGDYTLPDLEGSYMKVTDSTVLHTNTDDMSIELPDRTVVIRSLSATYSPKASRKYNTVTLSKQTGYDVSLVQTDKGGKWKLLNPSMGDKPSKTEKLSVDTRKGFEKYYQKVDKLPSYMNIKKLNSYVKKSNYFTIPMAGSKQINKDTFSAYLPILWYGDLLKPNKGEPDNMRNAMGYIEGDGTYDVDHAPTAKIALNFSESAFQDVNQEKFEMVSKEGDPLTMDAILSYKISNLTDDDGDPSDPYTTYYFGLRNNTLYAMSEKEKTPLSEGWIKKWEKVRYYPQYDYKNNLIKQ